MAGIGFELRRMIDQGQGLLSRVRGYASAGLISSGPWIMTIVTLAIVNAFGPLIALRAEYELFRGMITYAFAFSLIGVGVLQMTVTRRVADLLYMERHERVLPAFNATVTVTGLVQAVIGGVFCWLAGLSPAFSFVSVSLYVILSITWLAIIWLGVTREYDEILKAYALGMVVVILSIPILGSDTDAVGLMTAYAASQGLTLVLLLRTVVRGMEAGGRRDLSILKSVALFPRLMVVGVSYNIAIWIDKMFFWFFDGTGAHPWIRFHPLYDTACFLAYLTVIPALAVNLVRVETSFYECYRAYYGAILGGTPLSVIDDKRKRLFANMHEGMVHLIRLQGAITVLAIIFAPPLMEWVALPPTAVRVFRAACVGAFFHVMLLVTLLMQMYFELRKEALLTSVVFMGLNGVFAAWSVDGGIATYGLGYAAAALGSLLLGYALMMKGLQRLDFQTFTSQPLSESERDRFEVDDMEPAASSAAEVVATDAR